MSYKDEDSAADSHGVGFPGWEGGALPSGHCCLTINFIGFNEIDSYLLSLRPCKTIWGRISPGPEMFGPLITLPCCVVVACVIDNTICKERGYWSVLLKL